MEEISYNNLSDKWDGIPEDAVRYIIERVLMSLNLEQVEKLNLIYQEIYNKNH